MADPAEWSSRANVENAALLGFDVNPDTRDDSTDSTKQNIREVVSATFEWAGVTQATMLWHVMMYRASTCAINTAAETGIALLTDGAPSSGTGSFAVKNFREIGASIYEFWHLMIWDDPTIYRVTADATVADAADTDLTVTTGTALRGLESDNTNNKLYWLGQAASVNYVYRCDQDGTNKTTIATLGGVSSALALDVSGSRVYFSDGVAIEYCGLDGSGPGTLLTKSVIPKALCVSGSYLYYEDAESIRRVAIPGGTGDTEILADTNLTINSIAASGDYLYYTASDGYLYRCDASDGGNITQVHYIGDANAYSLRIDSGYFYYCIQDGTETVYRIPTTGLGNAVALNADTNPARMAGDFDNDNLYVLSDDATIYEVDLTTVGRATLSVTPNITAAAAALGSDAPVYFFIPSSVPGSRSSPDGSMYTVTIDAEFKTAYQDIDQPEEA